MILGIRYPLLLLLLSVLLFFSCKTKKEITLKRPTGNKNPYHLIKELKKNEVDFKWLSLKASVESIIDDKKKSFKASIRIRKDSIIWISVSPLFGIELARVLISKDSIKLINRLSTNYFSGNFNYINEMFHTDINFEMLQALLMGNSIGLEDVEKPKSSAGKGYYLLSSFRKRKLKKAIEKTGKTDELVYSHWLEPENYKITRLSIYNFKTNRSLSATFDEYKEVGKQLFPYKIRLDINTDQQIQFSIDYSKVSFDKPLKLPFRIPEKYEQIY